MQAACNLSGSTVSRSLRRATKATLDTLCRWRRNHLYIEEAYIQLNSTTDSLVSWYFSRKKSLKWGTQHTAYKPQKLFGGRGQGHSTQHTKNQISHTRRRYNVTTEPYIFCDNSRSSENLITPTWQLDFTSFSKMTSEAMKLWMSTSRLKIQYFSVSSLLLATGILLTPGLLTFRWQ